MELAGNREEDLLMPLVRKEEEVELHGRGLATAVAIYLSPLFSLVSSQVCTFQGALSFSLGLDGNDTNEYGALLILSYIWCPCTICFVAHPNTREHIAPSCQF